MTHHAQWLCPTSGRGDCLERERSPQYCHYNSNSLTFVWRSEMWSVLLSVLVAVLSVAGVSGCVCVYFLRSTSDHFNFEIHVLWRNEHESLTRKCELLDLSSTKELKNTLISINMGTQFILYFGTCVVLITIKDKNNEIDIAQTTW